jgi:photosystem II stability/assembly factor-like uncharacterized protein
MHKFISSVFLALLCSFYASAQGDYWKEIPSGTDRMLTSISFGSAEVGYIGGADSTLLRTVNGGRSWQALGHADMPFSASLPDIVDLDFVSASTGFAVVSNLKHPVYRGTLCKTTDSGNTWTVVDSINVAAMRSFFFDEQNGFVIGSQFFAGKTLHRMHRGQWIGSEIFSYDPAAFLKAIDFFDTSLGVVGGDGGQVYLTSNGGASWDTVQTVVDTTINALKFLNAQTIIAGSDDNSGAVLISYNGGHSWQKDLNTLTFSYPAIKDVAASHRDSFIAVGHAFGMQSGIVLWMRQGIVHNFVAPHFLNALSLRDDSVAFIVGDSGLILSNHESLLRVPAAASLQGRVFPNPAAGYCIVEAAVPVTLQLFDARGRLVRSIPAAARQHRVSLRSLSTGVYTLHAQGPAGERLVRQLVVQ